MDNKLRASLLASYSKDVGKAYRELAAFVKDLRKDQLPQTEYRKIMAIVSGTCGAACSAASKRLFRSVVLDGLEKAKASGLDITPAVAQHSCERLLGRGVSELSTLESFSTPGRTAENKSRVSAADMADIETAILADLESVAEAMVEIKLHHKAIYKEESK